jgi:hypothetical protein
MSTKTEIPSQYVIASKQCKRVMNLLHQYMDAAHAYDVARNLAIAVASDNHDTDNLASILRQQDGEFMEEPCDRMATRNAVNTLEGFTEELTDYISTFAEDE